MTYACNTFALRGWIGNHSRRKSCSTLNKWRKKDTLSRLVSFLLPTETNIAPSDLRCCGQQYIYSKDILSFGSFSSVRSFSVDNGRPKFVPQKAAIKMTEKARNLFMSLLDNTSQETQGIVLKFQQSNTGEPRMVFTFDFIKKNEIGSNDEGVSLEICDDGTPKAPTESWNDGLKKLYVHHSAFLKVLGGTVDVEIKKSGSFKTIVFDREGNQVDPNN